MRLCFNQHIRKRSVGRRYLATRIEFNSCLPLTDLLASLSNLLKSALPFYIRSNRLYPAKPNRNRLWTDGGGYRQLSTFLISYSISFNSLHKMLFLITLHIPLTDNVIL